LTKKPINNKLGVLYPLTNLSVPQEEFYHPQREENKKLEELIIRRGNIYSRLKAERRRGGDEKIIQKYKDMISDLDGQIEKLEKTDKDKGEVKEEIKEVKNEDTNTLDDKLKILKRKIQIYKYNRGNAGDSINKRLWQNRIDKIEEEIKSLTEDK